MSPQVEARTCDNCRKRKIRCIGGGKQGSCDGCDKLDLECTHHYVKKKPGRKNSFALGLKASTTASIAQTPRSIPVVDPQFTYPSPSQESTLFLNTSLLQVPPPQPAFFSGNEPEAESSTRTSSSSFALSPSTRMSSTETTGLAWLDNLLDPSNTAIDLSLDGFNLGFVSDQAQLLSHESPDLMFASSSASGSVRFALAPSRPKEPQLEDITSWSNISHFISLFLQYLYPLLPLVHRPTFAVHLATRKDIGDSDFRALLLSIVAYVISQLPTSRLVNEQFDIEGLKRLQRKCHRTCKALQRTYYGPTNLTQITTIIFDMFYLLSIGLSHTAGARLGQAVNLAFSMGLHSDERINVLGLDEIEIQLRRRVFWQIYASDKTRAIPGQPMLINDFQGIPSLPEPIDDEYITAQGMFPQPSSQPSVITGFVAVCQVFRILSETFFYHRCITSGFHTIPANWSVSAESRLHEVQRDLPETIQNPMTNGTESARRAFAMQRANILITVAICKFALFDLRAALNMDKDQLATERESIAREIHSLLMGIPVEDLASNGESVRNKVYHIACALCLQVPTNHSDQELIRDWCNMMPPPPPGAAALDSRANSPPPEPE